MASGDMGQEDWKPGVPGEGVIGECPKFEVPEGRENWYSKSGTLKRSIYAHHLRLLQEELVKLQEWIKHEKLKVVVIFEGRDASGKGGVIKRITERLNPRVVRISALPTPTEREKTHWYFQRYVAHLPAGGEMVIFDRSWYNRAGVERVMEFCTREEYLEFARSVPEFERMLVRSGITLVKYWFSVSDEEQERRFQARLHNPMKRWKLSPMDLESRRLYREYSPDRLYRRHAGPDGSPAQGRQQGLRPDAHRGPEFYPADLLTEPRIRNEESMQWRMRVITNQSASSATRLATCIGRSSH
jgi:polyphosphate kinase 2